MIRRSHIFGLALFALAFSQTADHARAATASGSFAVSIRVASVCEANGLCGTALVHVVGTSATVPALLTPLAPTADREAGERIDTHQANGPVEIDF